SAAQIAASGITGPTATAPKRARHPCALAGDRRRPRRRRSPGPRLLLAQRRSNERILFFRRISVDAVWRRYEISEEEFLAAAKRSRAMGSQGSRATMPQAPASEGPAAKDKGRTLARV